MSIVPQTILQWNAAARLERKNPGDRDNVIYIINQICARLPTHIQTNGQTERKQAYGTSFTA